MMTELTTWWDEHGGYPERDCDPHSGSVWPGFPPHFMMPGIFQHPLQETQMFDPLRFHWPYPSSSPFLPTYSQRLPEPQLSGDPRFMDPVIGQQSVLFDTWFQNDPVLSSITMVDFHTSVDTRLWQHFQDGTVDLPPSVEFHPPVDSPHHPFEDESTSDFTVDIPQPMRRNSRSEELARPYESEPVFVTLDNAQSPGEDDGLTQEKDQLQHLLIAHENLESLLPVCLSPDVSVSASSDQFPEHNQAACSLNKTRGETSTKWLQISSKGTDRESKPMKPCNCSKSKCLKLYCSCFSNGEMCTNCNCTNCHNNTNYHMDRDEAIEFYLGRDPYAFNSKAADDSSTWVKGSRNRGCNCKHTGCLKNYCECYKANIKCSSSCNCNGCRNYDRNSQRDLEKELDKYKYKRRSSVLPGSTVEAVCKHLMLKAVKAERNLWSHEQAERMILEEFGLCLSQISKTMSRVQ